MNRADVAAGAVAAAYRALFRTALVHVDPEQAHHGAVAALRALGGSPAACRALAGMTAAGLEHGVRLAGIAFRNRFGLAAGFDKDAVAVPGLAALGFGHVEVGTVTRRAQPGNPRPRLFRLPLDQALVNRMGFNNTGAEAVAARIAALRESAAVLPVIGVNIGKSRVVPVEEAPADYRASTRLLAGVADYLAVNVSSPNTPGLRGLQRADRLEPVLEAVLAEAGAKPVLVKIAPDLDDDAVGEVAGLVTRLGLAGAIATNTTVRRDGLLTDPATVASAGEGGLSGPPLADRAAAVLGLLRAALPGAVLVGVGGVATAADVRRRISAGADLVQGYTAFLYRGPGWAAELARADRVRAAEASRPA